MKKSNDDKKWSGKSRGGSWGYGFFIFLIKKLGITTAYIFLGFVAPYFIIFAPKSTAAIWRYNRLILKYSRCKSIVKLFKHYYTFGQTLIDKIAIINGMASRYKFEFEGHTQFISLLDKGALMMIGGHVGCWEIGSSFFGDYASRLNVVMMDAEYEKIKERVDTSKFGYKIIAINDGGIESLLKIKQAIDAKQYVCFQGDRYTNDASSTKVNFMGKPAQFPLGPSLLASKFKTPVVLYFAMREPGRKYRFIFKIYEQGLSQNEILQNYINDFEAVVQKYPQQWFNFFDLWQYESH